MALLSPSRPPVVPRPSAGVWPGLFDVPRVPVHAEHRAPAGQGRRQEPADHARLPGRLQLGCRGPALQITRPETSSPGSAPTV